MVKEKHILHQCRILWTITALLLICDSRTSVSRAINLALLICLNLHRFFFFFSQVWPLYKEQVSKPHVFIHRRHKALLSLLLLFHVTFAFCTMNSLVCPCRLVYVANHIKSMKLFPEPTFHHFRLPDVTFIIPATHVLVCKVSRRKQYAERSLCAILIILEYVL